MKYLFLLLSFVTLSKSYIFLNFHSTGLLLPYSLGITSYIKHNYNISNYKLRGISGGAFCALLFHYENKLDNYDDLCHILNIDKNSKIYLPINLNYSNNFISICFYVLFFKNISLNFTRSRK